MISDQLANLPGPVAAEHLQALALGREPRAAAVGGDDKRGDRDRDVVVAALEWLAENEAAEHSATLAASWPVAMKRAAIPLAEWAPLLLTPAMKPPRFDTCRARNSFSALVCMCSSISAAGSVASATTRLPRVRRMLTCELFLSVAKFDSSKKSLMPA